MDLSDTLSILAALCALALTLNQIRATRKHNYLSVRPFLRFGWTAGENDDGIWIKNVGLGPAIITDFSILKDGIEITTRNIEDQLSSLGFDARMTVVSTDAIIQKSEQYWIVRSLDRIECGNDQERFWSNLKGVTFKVSYKSFYSISAKDIEWVTPNPTESYVRGKPKNEVVEVSAETDSSQEQT